MLSHLQIVDVPVRDQDRAFAFYVDTLGFEVRADLTMGPHGRWLQVAPTGAATSLALTLADDGTTAAGQALVMESSDIEEDVRRLTEAGVSFEEGIEEMPWARVARFRDPDGNQLALQTPLAS
jgi:predicted enzyme related to lactoylglutathione lyase